MINPFQSILQYSSIFLQILAYSYKFFVSRLKSSQAQPSAKRSLQILTYSYEFLRILTNSYIFLFIDLLIQPSDLLLQLSACARQPRRLSPARLMTPMLRCRIPPFKLSTRQLPLPKTCAQRVGDHLSWQIRSG